MNRMRRRTLLAAAVSTLLVVSLTACAADVAAGGSTPREPHGPLQVYAAASLSEAFDAIAAAFEDEHPAVDVTAVYDGSSTLDRKSTRLNSSHSCASRMPSSA